MRLSLNKGKFVGVVRFREPVYGTRFEVLVSLDEAEGSRFIGADVGEAGAMTMMEGMCFRIWFREVCIGHVAHEAYHCAVWLKQYIQGDGEEELDEPMAYYIGWLVGEIWKRVGTTKEGEAE